MEAWYQNTCLWGQVNLTEMDPVTCDLEVWKNYWKRAEMEGVIINCSGIVSYYPSGLKGQYCAAGLSGKDYFGTWNQAAREAGLKVIARMDINCTTKELFELHPEWYCRDAQNQPILSQGRYVACVNGGYYQEHVPKVFREVIERYHPDGFADNSWAGLGMHAICYCENCRQAFRDKYGCELPEEADWDDPVYRNWVRWSFDIRVKNWAYFNEVTTQAGGENCRWFGMINADPFAVGNRFYDIKKLVEHTPFIFCDHQSRDKHCGFEQNSLNGMLLKLASDENVIIAESMAHYYKGERTFRLSSAQPQEVRKWMMTGIAGGISPWFHVVGGNVYDERRLHISDDIFRWIKKNKKMFLNQKNMADIGVVWNQETAVYYGRNNPEIRSAACFRGMTEALSRAGIPFLPVHADDIAKYADRLKLLILPNVAILSDAQQGELVQWLKEGKHLILTDDTGMFDEDGCYKGGGILYEMLGIRPCPQTQGVTGIGTENWMVHDTHSYLEITERQHPIFSGTPDTELLPFGGQLRTVSSDGTLKMLGTLIPSFPLYPPEFSWIREKSDAGAVYAGTLQTGSRVVYFAADIDRCYSIYHIPDHRKILEAAVRWAMPEDTVVSVQAPAHVNCCAYESEYGFRIHLTNLAGCTAPLGAQEEMLPIGPVAVRIRLPEQVRTKLTDQSGAVLGLWSGRNYQAEVSADTVEISIPVLEEQEVIFIEK